jgi:hypothetical protein
VFRRVAPPHLPRHLLFRVLAYRLQADKLGDLDNDTRRLLATPEQQISLTDPDARSMATSG